MTTDRTVFEVVVIYGECFDRSMWATRILAEIDGIGHAAKWLAAEANVDSVDLIEDPSGLWVDEWTGGYVEFTEWKVHTRPITVDPSDTLIVEPLSSDDD